MILSDLILCYSTLYVGLIPIPWNFSFHLEMGEIIYWAKVVNSSANYDLSVKRKCEHIQTGKAYAVKVISRR